MLKNKKIYIYIAFFLLNDFLCDALGVISKPTLIFERRDVILFAVESQVTSTIEALKKLKRKPGGAHYRNIEKRAREMGIIVTEEEQKCFELNARLFIDILVENITVRMANLPIITMLSILDLSNYSERSIFYGTSEITESAEFYKIDGDDLLAEWDEFKSLFLVTNENDATSKSLTICYLNKMLADLELTVREKFSNIKKLLSVANILPVSTAEVERIFSQVKLIVTNHRNKLKIENVDSLISIKCNSNDSIWISNAIKYWLSQKDRRLFNY